MLNFSKMDMWHRNFNIVSHRLNMSDVCLLCFAVLGHPQKGKSKKGKSKFWMTLFLMYPFTLQGYIRLYPRYTKIYQDIGAGAGPGGTAPPPSGILYILVYACTSWIY